MFETTRKFINKQPTETQLSAQQSEQSFKPSTRQVINSSVTDALQGIGTAYQASVYLDIAEKKISGTPISEEEFNERKGNAPLTYSKDMTKESFEVLKQYHDELNYRDFVSQKATGLQSVAGFVGGMGAGFADPKNIATAIGSGVLVNKAFSTIAKQTGRAVLSSVPLKRTLQVGAASALVESAVNIPVDVKVSKELQQDWEVGDAIKNAAISATLGVGFDVGLTAWGARRGRINEEKRIRRENPLDFALIDVSKKYNLDADVMYSIMMAESGGNPNAVNPDTKAYGFWQAMPDTAKEYGVSSKSSLQEQADAFARFTHDNVSALEKALNREPNAAETYLAHWLGRAGAIEVLKADPNASFVHHMRKTPYYKKDGVSYANKVMTQNRLPRNATMSEVVNAARERVSKHMGSSKYIPTSKDLLEKIDAKTNQALNGQEVNLDAVVAKQVVKNYQDGMRFIEKYSPKFEEAQIRVAEKFKQVVNDYNLDDITPETILDVPQRYVENIQTRIQKNRDDIYKIQKELNIPDLDKPSVLEIDNEFYKKEFEDLNKKRKEYNNLTNKILSLDIQEDIKPPPKQKQSPIRAEKLKILKAKHDGLKKDIDAHFRDIVSHSQDAMQNAERAYKESIAQQMDILRQPVYNFKGADEIDEIHKSIDSFNQDKEIENLEKLVQEYADKGLLTNEELETLKEVNKFSDADLKNMKNQTISCLLGITQ